MDRLSLKKKLAIGFGTLPLILVVMASLAYRAFSQLDVLSDQVDDRAHKVELTRTIEAASMKESAGIRGYLLLNQESLLDRLEEGKREYKESADGIREKLRTEE